jgi:uncharacterized membrane protein HdeD (DUF308 family)
MGSVSESIQEAGSNIRSEMSKGSKWFMLLGAGLMLGGIAAIISPNITGVALTKLIAWILILEGVLYIANSLMSRGAGGYLHRLILGTIHLGIGLIILTNPAESLVALTLILGLVLLFEGIVKLALSRVLSSIPGAKMLVLSGVVSVFIGIAVLVKLPESSEFLIGSLIGLNLIQTGITLIWIARKAKAGSTA